MTLPIHLTRAEQLPHPFPHNISDAPATAITKPAPPVPLSINGVEVPLHTGGVVRGADLAKAGIRVYDPGYKHTLHCKSAITAINGTAGTLSHRGYSIDDLVATCTFTEVAHLLLRGALPSPTQHTTFIQSLQSFAYPSLATRIAVKSQPPSAHPMGMLVSALAATGANVDEFNTARTPLAYDSEPKRLRAICAVLGSFPMLVAGVFRKARGERVCFQRLPRAAKGWEFARRFLWLVDPLLVRGPQGRARVRAVDALLTVHADHEQNCSTATLRQLTSSGVDVFSAVAGATAALYGPLHGGASESVVKMLSRIGSVANVGTFLQRVKRQEERLMGFGHRVYKNYDPRARIIRKLVKQVVREARDGMPLLEVAEALEDAALKDSYFVERKLFPNVDFYSGLVYMSMGFKPEFFPVMFALGRSAGWMAHWLEFLDDPDKKIARPHQIYVGHTGPRTVVPIGEREDAQLLPLMKKKRPLAKL